MEENNFFHRLLFLLLLYDVFIPVRCTIQTSTFYTESSMNGKICVESERTVQLLAKSKIYCSKICDEDSACTSVFYKAATRSCTVCKGYNNVKEQPGTICLTKPSTLNLEGKQFKIIAKENGRYWHCDGFLSDRPVTAMWQPDDDYVKFMFEKQMDGSYKIKSVGVLSYIYDGSDVIGAYLQFLNGKDSTDDDHMRYIVTMETTGYYRIQTKATGRYVRLDIDFNVSSRFNKKDDRSLFQLVEV